MRITAADYIQQRLDDQLDWHGRRSTQMQRAYQRFRGIELVLAASIPIVALNGAMGDWNARIAGLLGAVLTVIAGFLHLQRYETLWLQYRATAESLRREKFLFLTNTAHYAGVDGFRLLVERVERILDEQNGQWETAMRRAVVDPTMAEQNEAAQASAPDGVEPRSGLSASSMFGTPGRDQERTRSYTAGTSGSIPSAASASRSRPGSTPTDVEPAVESTS